MRTKRKRRDEILEHALGMSDHPGDAEADSLRDLVAGLRALPRQEPGRDLTPGILARIACEDRAEELSFAAFPRIWLAAAAVLIFLLGAGVLLFRAHSGGPEAGRAAMLAASTDWLIRTQDGDGSWDPARWGGKSEYTVALTGLAMMALAGPESAERNPAAAGACGRAAGYLVSQQGTDGCFGPSIGGRLYNHGIATAALLAGKPPRGSEADEAIGRAFAFMTSAQSPEGAWGYTGGSAGADNTSITVWQVRALMEARSAGRKGLDAPLGRAVRWLAARVDDRGRFGYETPGDSGSESKALTAMGASCVMDPRIGGVATLKARVRPALSLLPRETGLADFYRDFFLVDALEKAGDREALAMAESIRGAMSSRHGAAREPDGSWTPDERWGRVGGRVYSTALAALSLDARRRM